MAGARVRVIEDRPTADGIRQRALVGTVSSADSARIILLGGATSTLDTVSLLGIRRLDLFQGTRSRGNMVATGATVGAIGGFVVWIIARSALRPTHYSTTVQVPGGGTRVVQLETTEGRDARRMRNAIPLVAGIGAVVGSLIGVEHWVRIPDPQSVFPQARQ